MRVPILAPLVALVVACSAAGTDGTTSEANETEAAREAKVAAALDAVRDDADKLAAFLHEMPKGADLHNHLTGSIYAETFLAWAKQDGLCLDATLAVVPKFKCHEPGATAIPTEGTAGYD